MTRRSTLRLRGAWLGMRVVGVPVSLAVTFSPAAAQTLATFSTIVREGIHVGVSFTPNSLINSDRGQDRLKTWQAKLNGTTDLPVRLRAVAILGNQSGAPFARTFVQTPNYGHAVTKGERFVNRTPNSTLLDLRTEKWFRAGRTRVMRFFDVYNVFNTSAVLALTGPRILRTGGRWDL